MEKINLYVKFEPEHWSRVCRCTIPASWNGWTEKIVFTGGSRLDGELATISGDTRDELIQNTIDELKKRGVHGTLKVVPV